MYVIPYPGDGKALLPTELSLLCLWWRDVIPDTNENSINVLLWKGLQDVLVSEESKCRALPRVCYFECNKGG